MICCGAGALARRHAGVALDAVGALSSVSERYGDELFGHFRQCAVCEDGMADSSNAPWIFGASGPEQAAALAHLRELASGGTLTLLTASKDIAISKVTVLAELIDEQLRE
jgi:hypothetical protein